MTNRILQILDNVRYWDTCPEDYKKDIETFLEAQNQALRIHDVSRSAVKPLVETLFMIATAPHPANDFEYKSFVETAKRIAQKALDDFDKHFC